MSLQIGNTTITPVSKRDQQNIHDSINLNDDDMSERDEAEGDESALGLSDAESGAEMLRKTKNQNTKELNSK
jgi:sentrin-specific protease 7